MSEFGSYGDSVTNPNCVNWNYFLFQHQHAVPFNCSNRLLINKMYTTDGEEKERKKGAGSALLTE